VWDVNGCSGRGTDAVEVGNKSGANCGTGEVLFHHAEFALGTVFPLVKLNSLALYHLKLALVCPISIDVSNNTRIPEIDDGVVDKKSGSGRGVENVEVVIFDPRAIEIGSGMCTCMKGDGKLRVAMLASPYKVSVNPDLPEGDIACHLILPILVEEDKRVLPHITAVVLAPSISWMVRVLELLSKLRDVGDGARCGGEGNGRVVPSEPNWFVVLYVVV